MDSVPRYCARGKLCKLYDPETSRAQKLGRYHKGDICGRCEKAGAGAFKYEQVRFEEDSLKAQLIIKKRNLVTQMLCKRGSYWEAIKEVRAHWQLDPVPTQLPPESEDILYPPGVPTRQPPKPMEYILHPNIPNPYMGEPGDYDEYMNWRELTTLWEVQLAEVLRQGVPERYLGQKTEPYTSWLSPQQRSLPWWRFAAACVLYDPPFLPEEAAAFADYGGLPFLPKEGSRDETPLRVLDERELREVAIDRRVENAMHKVVSKKIWELRSELSHLDFDQARREVQDRYGTELEAERERLRWELYEREIGLNHLSDPPCYFVEFIPSETTENQVKQALKTIQAKKSVRPQDSLLRVVCARLLEEGGWSSEDLGKCLGLSSRRVQELAKEGRKLLKRDD